MALFRLTLKNIRARWIRYALTGLAVVLGVGFVVGTFIITDGLRSTFDDLAADIAGDIDLLVRSDQEFGGDAIAAILDPGIADELAEIDGVTTVEGGVFGPGVKVVDAGGESVGEGFTAGFSFGPASSTFLVTDGAFAGREPTGPDEFAINTTAAEDADLVIGEIYSVSAVGGVRDMTLVGVFNWADPEDDQTIAGSLVAFDLDTAIDFVVDGAGITQVALGVDDDTDVTLVADAVRAAVGDDIEVVSNETVQAETEDDFGEFIDIFGNILLGFAIVTLIVSAFIIYNTFAIVISQRVRELGLLRSLGASGRQITLTILGESVVVGIAATVLGIGAGLGVAAILRAILDALGGGFPGGPLPITTRTVVVAAIMGIGVTVGSSIIPALRARRVSPLAALRDDVR
ncbi:MAG: ABC transporter permease, partial [Acidimicrobiia bacterium]|nr:ABC transporter permease [Acidimicrobiia bacterium]